MCRGVSVPEDAGTNGRDEVEREQQRQFVVAVCANITEYIHARINDGRIPEDWDGSELRRLIADVAREQFTEWRYKGWETRRYNMARSLHNI